MGLTVEQRQRVAELVEELHELLGNSLHSDGRPMTFAELEDECIELGDRLTTGVLERRVAERAIRHQPPGCPECGRDPIALAEDEARVLQTDRGEVGWMESAYECRHCRRQFFPSDG